MLLFLLSISLFAAQAQEENSTIASIMYQHEIIPDVIDIAPPNILIVEYGNETVSSGNELTPTQVKDIPIVKWIPERGSYYLLCMTDPDAPSRANPVRREFRHWLVGNIPDMKVDEGENLSDYIGAGPPEGTGLHRYVFLLYKQPGKLTFTEQHVDNRTRDTRPNFSIKAFAEKYNLGTPVAGNFFQAQYDDYVPTLHAQFGAAK